MSLERHANGLWILAIIICGFLAYANAFSAAWIFDDYRNILENDTLTRFPDVIIGSSRPLTALTFFLNARLLGMSRHGFQAVNLAIHLVNGILVFVLLQCLQHQLACPRFLSKRWLAGVTATAWTVHPLTTECVTYIVQRGESLMGFFLLVSVIAMLRSHADDRQEAPRGCHDRWHWLSALACLLGMLAKPVMVTAPLILLAVDVLRCRAPVIDVMKTHSRFYRLMGVAWVCGVVVILLPNESSSSVGLSAALASPWGYAWSQAGVLLHYLRTSVVPTGLCLDYAWPLAEFNLRSLTAFACMAGLVGLSLMGCYRRRPWALAGVWFFGILLPTSSVFPIADMAADRRMYLPLIAPLAVLVCVLAWGVTVCRHRGRHAALAAVIVVMLSALIAGTHDRNRHYASTERMWRQVLRVAPHNLRAHAGVAAALLRDNRTRDAEQHLRMAEAGLAERNTERLGPDRTLLGLVRAYCGIAELQHKHYARAERCFHDAYSMSPANVMAGVELVRLLMARGAREEAHPIVLELSRRVPDNEAVEMLRLRLE